MNSIKFLFLKFSKCHNVYNSSRYLEQEEIDKLEAGIIWRII